MLYFQDVVAALSAFWAQHGCVVITPYDVEKGAGTSNPNTLLRALGPEPFSAAYIEPCRRPKDGRYGTNPNRLQHYFQYQVILKPCPDDIVDLYLESLRAIGLDTSAHDIRFVHDDWENPTLGAWGLGWEVWLDGMEATQFTYFQAAASTPLSSITGEITYGIERLSMALQGVNSIFDLKWNEQITYGDLYLENEVQWSTYNFEQQDDTLWMRHFTDFQKEAKRLALANLPIPAYDFVIKASHAFNMLDAKGVISVSERASYIAAIRDLAKMVADSYLLCRERLGFPMVRKATPLPKAAPERPLPSPKEPAERFLLEIGTEELPAAVLPNAIKGLQKAMETLLTKEGLSYSSIRSYGAPRRLAVLVEALATSRPAAHVERRGPRADAMWDEKGALSQAGEGFLKGLGLPLVSCQEAQTLKGLEIREVKGTPYVFTSIKTPAVSTAHILQKTLPSLIRSLEFPKSMRWGDHQLSFCRPIRWITALLNSDVIPFSLEHLHSDRYSYGHRQLKPGPVEIFSALDYEQALEEAFVMVDQQRRKDHITSELRAIEQRLGQTTVHTDRVVNQLIHLSEWPQVTVATFDPTLLAAPKEVLILEMVEHQKYLPLVDKDGRLCPQFIMVADNAPTELVKQGNTKVLSARLADGKFLWNEDAAVPLQTLREKLKTIVYQKELGTLFQKTERLETLARSLHPYVQRADLTATLEAARLSKSDIASLVVGEFPELQGVIGGLLATEQGLPFSVATAIREHWLPTGEEGALPASPEGTLLSISDKIDTLVGFFAIGLKPTSSSDPFALRRQAIGLIRMVLENKIHLSLHETIAKTLTLFPAPMYQAERSDIIKDLQTFVVTRAKGLFLDRGYRKGTIEAVLSIQSDDLYDALLRLMALCTLEQSPSDLAALVEVIKRCHGQVDLAFVADIQPKYLEVEAEREAFTALDQAECTFMKAAKYHDWSLALEALLSLRAPIDRLFCDVKVLADDPKVRHNRLSLLRRMIGLCASFADINKLEISVV